MPSFWLGDGWVARTGRVRGGWAEGLAHVPPSYSCKDA